MVSKQTVQNIDSVRQVLAIAFIGVALCLMIYNEVKMIVPLQEHNLTTFISYNHDVIFGARDTAVGRMDLEKSWRPRILGRMLGSLITKPADTPKGINKSQFIHLVGVYVGVWLGLTFLLYLLTLGKNALIPILGTYAAVAFCYMPGIGDRVYPWDMPMLFFFTLFVCLLIKEKLPYFIFIIPIATLFRQSVAMLVSAYLFLPGSIRRRLLLFSAAAAAYATTKVTADVLTNSTGSFAFDPTLLLANLRYLLTGFFPDKAAWYPTVQDINYPIFLNAGLLIAFIVYPFRDRNALMLSVIVLSFVAAMFLFGIIFEYRGWLELTPILLYPLYMNTFQTPEGPALETP
jgi:hypothetical protein